MTAIVTAIVTATVIVAVKCECLINRDKTCDRERERGAKGREEEGKAAKGVKLQRAKGGKERETRARQSNRQKQGE